MYVGMDPCRMFVISSTIEVTKPSTVKSLEYFRLLTNRQPLSSQLFSHIHFIKSSTSSSSKYREFRVSSPPRQSGVLQQANSFIRSNYSASGSNVRMTSQITRGWPEGHFPTLVDILLGHYMLTCEDICTPIAAAR